VVAVTISARRITMRSVQSVQSERISTVFSHSEQNIYTAFKKRGVKLFAVISSTVNRFRKFFHCWKQQRIICKTEMIFSLPLKTSLYMYYRVKHKNFKCCDCSIPLFDNKAVNSTIFSNILKHLKKHITFLIYLLPPSGARVPVTSSQC